MPGPPPQARVVCPEMPQAPVPAAGLIPCQHRTMSTRSTLQRRALRLEYATIGWNAGEAVLTIALGIAAASLALVGFGADSIIEIFASSVVVWHLVAGGAGDHRERTARALRLVSAAFVLLAGVLIVVALRDLITGRRPDASPWGIAYLAVTAVVMVSLAVAKRRTARALRSAPLHAEATMTFLDGVLATATTIGLALNALLEWWWADPAAALVVALAAVNEGRETWGEAATLG